MYTPEQALLLGFVAFLACMFGRHMFLRICDAMQMDGFSYSYWLTYLTTDRADRIFGYVSDRVTNEGWSQVMVSLWRVRRTGEFMVSKTYEVGDRRQKVAVVTRLEARKMIVAKAPTDKIEQLVADWIDAKGRAM